LKLKLTMEPILTQNWHKSLANLLPKPVWDTVRRDCYKEFNYLCAICGEGDIQCHCHEVWTYDDKKHIQFLKGVQCLCPDCHNIKHWGRLVNEVHSGKLSLSELNRLAQHFCRVNKCSMEAFEQHKLEVFTLREKRDRHTYKIDWGKLSPERVEKEWLKRKRQQ